MNTANHCVGLGRPLMAVPGPVTSPMSSGCHTLLGRDANPAILVSTSDDVLGVVGGVGEGPPPAREGDPKLPAGDLRVDLDQLDPTARRVFEGLLVRRFARPDEIAARSGVSPLEVIRALPTLDLAGLIETGEAGYRVASRRPPR
jgi:DNA processing protein